MYSEVAKISEKNKSINKIVKKEKKIQVSFPITPQTMKITATMCDSLSLSLSIYREREREIVILGIGSYSYGDWEVPQSTVCKLEN